MSQLSIVALLTAVLGTIGYHLAQRRIEPDVNPALVLDMAYLVGAGICGILLLTLFPVRTSLRTQFGYPMLVLGMAVVLIEVGFLWMYRSGWSVATGALAVNVLATIALAAVGVVAFGERLQWTTVVGATICLFGLCVMSVR